jgi:hypothetical protein
VLNNHLRRLRGEQVENHYQFRVVHQSGDIRVAGDQRRGV